MRPNAETVGGEKVQIFHEKDGVKVGHIFRGSKVINTQWYGKRHWANPKPSSLDLK